MNPATAVTGPRPWRGSGSGVVDLPAFDLPFSTAEFDRRLTRTRSRMRAAGLEAVLLTEPADLYYLTGYDTQGFWTFQALLVTPEGPPALVCFVEEVGHARLRGLEPAPYAFGADPVLVTQRLLEERGLHRATIGFDLGSRFLPVIACDRLRAAMPGAAVVDLAGLVEQQRLMKSPAEVEYLRHALSISNAAMSVALSGLRAGVCDRTIALALTAECIARGSDYFTQSPYVRFGPSMVEGHLTWQGRRLAEGDAFELEVAAVRRRYTAPVVRFGMAGTMDRERATAAALSRAGLDEVLSAARPGVRGGDLWAAARAAARGRDLNYLPGGYSVGIGYPPDWTEADVVAADSEVELRAGMVIHMVSFCQLSSARIGTGQVILVTADGCRALAAMPGGPVEVS